MQVRFEDQQMPNPTSDAASQVPDSGGQMPATSDPPPPYEEFEIDQPKPMPSFEADPVRHLIGMKLATTKTGFCACSLRSTNFSIAFYMACYASLLICDYYEVIPDFIRTVYSYKFQLFIEKKVQYVLNGWIGIFLLIGAVALWLATYFNSRSGLMAWLCIMLGFALMTFVLWLLGLLLSLSADGWNIPATQGISVGTIDTGLELYVLHMVYSYNRYMYEPPATQGLCDVNYYPQHVLDLEQMGYREVNVMGMVFTAPMPHTDNNEQPPTSPPTSRPPPEPAAAH